MRSEVGRRGSLLEAGILRWERVFRRWVDGEWRFSTHICTLNFGWVKSNDKMWQSPPSGLLLLHLLLLPPTRQFYHLLLLQWWYFPEIKPVDCPYFGIMLHDHSKKIIGKGDGQSGWTWSATTEITFKSVGKASFCTLLQTFPKWASNLWYLQIGL